MNLMRILAALLAVGVLVGCEQAAEEPMTELEPAAEGGEEAAEEPMTELEPAAEGGDEPMTELEPAAEGGDEPMTELEPAAEGGDEPMTELEPAAEGGDGGETADDAMDASEMPADADDGRPPSRETIAKGGASDGNLPNGLWRAAAAWNVFFTGRRTCPT